MTIVTGLLLTVVAWPSVTSGAVKRATTVEQSRHLWATVNVCDPDDRPEGIGPDTIGVRASMPGSRDGRELMYMRFRVQYLSNRDDRWHSVTKGGDSGWKKVGRARYKARQSGRNFRLSPPSGRDSIELRGRVNFQWRLRGDVVRRAAVLTTKGHRSRAGTYPANFSAATCTVTS